MERSDTTRNGARDYPRIMYSSEIRIVSPEYKTQSSVAGSSDW